MFKINWLGLVTWLIRRKLNGGEINRLAKSLTKHNKRYRIRAMKNDGFREHLNIIERLDEEYFAQVYGPKR